MEDSRPLRRKDSHLKMQLGIAVFKEVNCIVNFRFREKERWPKHTVVKYNIYSLD